MDSAATAAGRCGVRRTVVEARVSPLTCLAGRRFAAEARFRAVFRADERELGLRRVFAIGIGHPQRGQPGTLTNHLSWVKNPEPVELLCVVCPIRQSLLQDAVDIVDRHPVPVGQDLHGLPPRTRSICCHLTKFGR